MVRSGKVAFPPAHLAFRGEELLANGNYPIDGVVDVTWGDLEASYVLEYKRSNTPRIQREVIERARYIATASGLNPLVILPYMGEEALLRLEESQISGIDLCGNGLLIAPDFRLRRTGHPNQFKDTRPIRNPFHGDSSIFARCFLLRKEYASLQELLQFAKERAFENYPSTPQTVLTQGTASKVVQTLTEELVVHRDGTKLNLRDPKRLIALLRQGRRGTNRPTLAGTTSYGAEKIWELLKREREYGGLRAVATGISSAGHYGVLSGVDKLSLYVDNIDKALATLQIRPGKAFANIQIFEDKKNSVYFDSRQEGDTLWSSPIQTWLELASGGPREQEAAEELERILTNSHGDIFL